MCISYATATTVFLLLLQTCYARKQNLCAPSSCGNIHNITYPFRLQTDPTSCGDPRYTFSCQNNSTILYLYSGKYYVQAINYSNFTIRLVDVGVRQDDCSSIPSLSLTDYNFTYGDPYTWYYYHRTESNSDHGLSDTMSFIQCTNPVTSALYVETDSCISVNSSETYYYVHAGSLNTSDLMDFCRIELMAMLPKMDYKNMSFLQIHRELAYGFELSWFNLHCPHSCKKGCYLDGDRNRMCFGLVNLSPTIVVIRVRLLQGFIILVILHFMIKALCGTPCVIVFFIYKWRRRHLSAYGTIEEFLHRQNSLMPVRYSYSEVKRMTRNFKDKLGEGGFGSVYKAKLRSGKFAAVKMLGKSKSNGQDFINEVATIGRIYHTNVVRLIGFCVEGSKQALVYDFMANGSLDKHIFTREGSVPLSLEKLYQISIEVARGLEYLHRGCDMQILHFDIKPHNILLDENFTPKISDFGLAKLYPVKGSIASLTAARGTIGYMAPELFYKNIGRVSYKADVYSFGMLLLEMAGRRKNLNALAENSSQIYFPFWVYDQVSDGKNVAVGDATEEENDIAKKMVVVGLWCIQLEPNNRPPMNKVIQMLEGDMQSLQLPPRPVLYPDETMRKIEGESSSVSVDFTNSVSSIINVDA